MANPFLAVEYLDMQIAMVKLDDTRWVYGGARMAERLAFAAHTSSGPLIEVPNWRNYYSVGGLFAIL